MSFSGIVGQFRVNSKLRSGSLQLLEAGDSAGLRQLMLELKDLFAGEAVRTQDEFANSAAPAVDKLRDKFKDFDGQRRKLLAGPDDGTDAGRRRKDERIGEIQAGARAAQGAIEQLTQAQERFFKDAYGPNLAPGRLPEARLDHHSEAILSPRDPQ
ncbi:MAG: hypothetical protein NTW21_43200 [Verrucomicrobia bacterium]|nr:hypothetical protein [Verrucomicrobiota bacterium]